MHVVDYGCAHGHFIIPLAKAFPDCTFTGVDISDRAIGKALEWVNRDNISNVNLVVGTSNDLSKVKEAQVIIACEVLEHVPEMQKVVDKLRAKLVDGGTLIATTPYGRWEWIGTEAFKNGREHLHHFDRKDIDEVFEDFSHEFICAPAGHDQGSEPIGSFVWSFIEDKSCDLRSINFNRKFNEYAPRQTLSACMIVSNAMKTIEACLDSMVDAVDEFVIMIDPKTNDVTEQFLYEYANKHPFKSFVIDDGLDALKEGFDAARNLSISRASGDWILWCDADEIVHNKWALQKLLRTSCNDGYAMAQVHYAIDPAQVLTTDMPCRLFRNNIGVKFYGVVHEHPETEIGKAVPHTMLCGDVKFLHNGYIDEPTRRARFQRNLPLLHRDFEKHPKRYLTKFLMLRDLSQGLSFEIESHRGLRPADYAARTSMAIKLFEELIEEAPLRLVVDAVGFYSNCVEIMQAGFTAEFNIAASKDVAPDLSVNTSVKGRFLNNKHYLTLVDKLAKEAVKHFESKHL
jgi:glycosyltransferase involved in cell wall biosynthesis